MADTTNDARPVNREYLDLRLGALEDRIDRKLAELELRIIDRFAGFERKMYGVAITTLVAVLGTLIAVIVK